MTIACLVRTISVMSKSVSVIITDDLDGSENAETVSFGFDGVTYEIDLGKKNWSRLKRALAPFIEAGRRRGTAAAVAPAALVGPTCGPQRRAGLGQGGCPKGLRARPDQRRHHAAIRRGLLGRNLRDLGCRWEGCSLRGRRVRGAGWVGAAGFWRTRGTGAPGSSKTRRWTGVRVVSFSGPRRAEADGLAGEGAKAAGQVAVVAAGSWPLLCLVVSLAFARAERCAETTR